VVGGVSELESVELSKKPELGELGGGEAAARVDKRHMRRGGMMHRGLRRWRSVGGGGRGSVETDRRLRGEGPQRDGARGHQVAAGVDVRVEAGRQGRLRVRLCGMQENGA
jgi:hypothetical protein